MYKLYLQMFADYGKGTNSNLNTTTSPGLSVEMKTYYEKRLLDEAEGSLVHDQFATKYPIPKNGGKTIEFRKVNSLPKNLATITEGVTPDGQAMAIDSFTATVDQYGGWVGLTDVVQMTTIDPMLEITTKALGSQAGRTLDTVTREVMNGGTVRIFADKVVGDTTTEVELREDVTADCHLGFDPIFKAAAQLKTQNASPFGDSYIGIIHPYSSYDIMSNPQWIDVNKYSNTEKIYNGEIGKLAGVKFVETSEAKVFLPNELISGVRRMTVKTAISSSSTSVVVNGEYETASGLNIECYIGGVENTITAITKGTGSSTLTVGTAITNLSVGSIVCGKGAGKDGSAVFSTVILAKDAYGVTDIDGGVEHIVKPLGYGDDPLNQRGSAGWKALKVAKILNENYMVRIESGNAYSGKINNN